MCETIDSSNLRDFEAKYEIITSHQAFAEPQNARQFLKEGFLDSLDSVVLASE